MTARATEKKRRSLDWLGENAKTCGFQAGDVCVVNAFEHKGARGFMLGHLRSRRLVQVQFSAAGRSVFVTVNGQRWSPDVEGRAS